MVLCIGDVMFIETVCSWECLQSSLLMFLPSSSNSEERMIKLSVGGSIFNVSKEEVLASGSSVLTGVIQAGPYPDGEYFLDRDATHFQVILDYIRHGESALVAHDSTGEQRSRINYYARNRLLIEAKQLGLGELYKALENLKVSTPVSSASGRLAREALKNSASSICLSESELAPRSPGGRGSDPRSFAQCIAGCKPIAFTIFDVSQASQ